MTTQTELKVLTILRNLPLTADMKTEHLKKMAAAAREVEFSNQEIIYDEGHLGQGIYIIQSGQVAIEMKTLTNDYIIIHLLGAGELFGWSALFPAERKNARARAMQPSRAILLDTARLQAAWQQDQAFENALIQRTTRVMLDRIRNTRRQLADSLASPDKT